MKCGQWTLCDSVIPRWLNFQCAFSKQYGCDFLRWALLSQLERQFFCMEGDFFAWRAIFINGGDSWMERRKLPQKLAPAKICTKGFFRYHVYTASIHNQRLVPFRPPRFRVRFRVLLSCFIRSTNWAFSGSKFFGFLSRRPLRGNKGGRRGPAGWVGGRQWKMSTCFNDVLTFLNLLGIT